MIDSHDYQIAVTGTGPQTGVVDSPTDGLPEIQFSSPPEFGGPEHTWSPEHLFVAAIATCLMTTFRAIAANSGVEVLEYTDHSVGHLRRGEDGLYSIDKVTMRPSVLISANTNRDRALRLLEKAEKVCLVGRSVNSELALEPTVLQAHQVGT